jgi:hypothetical protein
MYVLSLAYFQPNISKYTHIKEDRCNSLRKQQRKTDLKMTNRNVSFKGFQ